MRLLPPIAFDLVARLLWNVVDESAQPADALIPVFRQVEAVQLTEADQPQVLIERAVAHASHNTNLLRREQVELAALLDPAPD